MNAHLSTTIKDEITKRPLVVALTGGIACGKTTVSNAFAQLGILIIDADVIARDLVAIGQPALAEIQQHFGPSIINADGTLHRSQLRARIFDQPSERQWLDHLMHPLIHQRIVEQIHTHAQHAYVMVVIPLLAEKNHYPEIDMVLVVDCTRDQQLQRLITRDQLDRTLAEKILAAQASREQRLTIADAVILNNTETSELPAQVRSLHQKISDMAAARINASQPTTAHQTPYESTD